MHHLLDRLDADAALDRTHLALVVGGDRALSSLDLEVRMSEYVERPDCAVDVERAAVGSRAHKRRRVSSRGARMCRRRRVGRRRFVITVNFRVVLRLGRLEQRVVRPAPYVVEWRRLVGAVD